MVESAGDKGWSVRRGGVGQPARWPERTQAPTVTFETPNPYESPRSTCDDCDEDDGFFWVIVFIAVLTVVTLVLMFLALNESSPSVDIRQTDSRSESETDSHLNRLTTRDCEVSRSALFASPPTKRPEAIGGDVMNLRRIALMGGILGVCLVGGMMLAAAGKPIRKDEGAPTIQQLTERIENLEKRIEQLERRQPSVVVPYRPTAQTVPKGWQRREFNGIDYYIVPLESPESPQTSDR